MSVEKKTIRSDIPGHNTFLNPRDSEDARRLVVGRDIVLQGVISSCDHLAVEGVVEAQSLETRRLEIMETGVFAGAAETRDAVIAGRFEGRLIVHGRLTLKSTARIIGEIIYGAMDIETGARIEASVTVMAIPEPVAAPVPVLEVANNNIVEIATETGDDDEGEEETTAGRTGVFRRAVGF